MNFWKPTLAAGLAAATLSLATPAPASADQAAATRNMILGAAAVVAGIAIESNVAHKRAAANSVNGYLQDGSTVYNDGRVVTPDGQTYYPGSNGGSVSCSNGNCYVYSNGTAPNGPYGYNGNGYDNNGYTAGYGNGYGTSGYNGNDWYRDGQGRLRHR